MSTRLLVCLCVCCTLADPFGRPSPQQGYQVAQWEEYTEHTQPGLAGHSSPAGRSYSSRTDWTGQPRQDTPLTPRRVYSREANLPGETGFGLFTEAQFEPQTSEANVAYQVNPQAFIFPRQIYNQPFAPNLSPAPLYVEPHLREESSRYQFRQAPVFPQVQNFHSGPQTRWFKSSSQSHSPHSQASFFRKAISPSSTTGNYDAVTRLKNQNIVKLRTTHESYFGKDNVPQQSIDVGYVETPSDNSILKNSIPDAPFNLGFENPRRISNVRGTFPRVDKDSYLDQSQWNGQFNFDQSLQLKGLINTPSTFRERSEPTVQTIYETKPVHEITINVTPPQYRSTTVRTNWLESISPERTHALHEIGIPHDDVTPFVEVTERVTNPPLIFKEPIWHDTKKQAIVLHKENTFINEGISQKEHLPTLYTISNINSKSQTPKHSDYLELNKGEIHGEVYVQDKTQWDECEGPEGQAGHCVPVEHCDLEGTYHHYSTQKYFCIIRLKKSIGICCVKTKTDTSEVHPAVVTGSPHFPGDDTNHPHDPHHLHHNHHHEHCIYPIADYKVCGRSGRMISDIDGPSSATVRDWPWMAVLVFRNNLMPFCGGTLITRRHVLTAAHCFRTNVAEDVLVMLGDYDVRLTNESQSRTFAVERLISNDDYDPASHENDIALLVLNATTGYNRYIQPACLPAPGPRYANQTAVIAGWGSLEYKGQFPDNLTEVNLPVWDQDICTPKFAQTIFNTSMCAGAFEGGRDSCQGDSGGPLMKQCYHSHRWIVIGVVSWGIRCGERDKPGVYTRVNDYLDWIHENIIENSTDTTNTTNVPLLLQPHHHYYL